FDDTIIANAAGNTVSGLGGNDFIQGRGRSDILIGGKGDDEVFGRNGDDLLVWNNGDGSDLLDGGNGDDRVQINFNTDLVNDDLQNDDVATFEDGPNGVEFARTEVNGQSQFGLFQLDIRDTETVETNFGGGDDTAVLIGSVLEESRLELDGGDGFDVLDLSQLDEGVEVDVENGTVGNLSFKNFEKIIGTDFDDIILADDAVEDVEGGDGIDTVDFSDVSEGLTIRQPAEIELAAELAVTAAAAEPERRVVVIDNVENIVGTEFADSIVADASSNTISGLGGNDFIQGRGRSDTLIGGKGDDEVFGGNGDDLLVWNNGDGSDLLDGGNGTDRVQVNFNTDLVNDDLQNDDTARIEDSAEGVAFARTELNGQTERGLFQLDIRNSEVLETNFGGGDDTAEIAGDILPPVVAVVIEEIEAVAALEPIALIPEGSFALELDGGAGTDTLDFSDLANGVFVDLEEDRANGATVVNFENVVGTDFNDVITGDDGDNTIFVSLGNDALDGGDGSDTVDFSKLDEGIEFSLEDQVSGESEEILAIEIEAAGPVGGTTFENFENVTGTDFNDVITGDDGDNVIRGGKGNDILESGEGADTFLFFEGDTGTDVLVDFEVGVDTLQFATTQDLDPQGLLGLLEQAGDDVELAFGGRTIVIENSEVSDFSADDFSVIEI
ncbi:MAG: calcium-binding protein, partial [Pseudomonadota bacterium]